MFPRPLLRGFGKITRGNWDTEASKFLSALHQADFVSFDFELTGLYMKSSERFIGADSCYEAYADGARNFLPVQLGMCAGRRNVDGSWRLSPISAFVLPSDEDFVFSSSSATLEFLVQNGIDLNAWISDGIRGLTMSQESERRAILQQRISETLERREAATSAHVKPVFGPPLEIPHAADRELVASSTRVIDTWLASSSSDSLDIELDSAFHRLLVHTVIGHVYPQVYSLSGKKGDKRVLTVFKSKGELYEKQLTTLHAELEKLSSEIGVRAFFQVISSRQIPIIGHNCLCDLLHAQKLFGGLPQDLFTFKSKFSRLFPLVYDTRVLTDQPNAPGTLRDLCDQMARDCDGMVIQSDSNLYRLPESCKHLSGGEVGADKSHDAGYDAMMTALVFLFNADTALKQAALAWGPKSMIQLDSILKNCVNKIKLVRTQPPVLSLVSKASGKIFRIQSLPTGWDKWRLLSAFAPVSADIEVDDSSAKIMVTSELDAESLLKVYRLKDLQSHFNLVESVV